MATHVLTIPGWHPAKVNELTGCHWGKKHRLKAGDRVLVRLEAFAQGVPRAKGKRRVSLLVTLAPRQRAGDPDSYWKSLLDALTDCSLLKNDSHAWCELGPVRLARAARKATTVVLEDVP